MSMYPVPKIAIKVYGISGNTPPKASHNADFSDLLIAVSITATFTRPKKTEPKKLKTAATKNATMISKASKIV